MTTPKLPPLPNHPEPRIMKWSELEMRTIKEYGEACAIAAVEAQGVPDEWQPTAENINALPDPVKRYIHDLVSNADPAGTVREVTMLRDQVRELAASNRMLRDQVAAIEAQGVPGDLRKEAKNLSSILASMGEGSYDIETLYTEDQADGDGFVQRAADLLNLLASAPPAPQAKQCEWTNCPTRVGNKCCNEQASAMRPDTLYLLRRLLSNQHTLTGAEFREELTKIVAEASAVQQEPVVAEWVERWHGSRTEEGWSILFQSLVPRDKVAYLGTGVSAEAVQAIVLAHNKAIATQQAFMSNITARMSANTPKRNIPQATA